MMLREKDIDGTVAKQMREDREAAERAAKAVAMQEDEIKAKQARIRELVKLIAAVFLRGDLGGDQKLDFQEFDASIPARMRAKHRDDEMREVFEMADSDGSGCLSRDEYFFLTLRWMAKSGSASGLERNFRRFDSSGDGELNGPEWTQAADRFGFGELGLSVFYELDADDTGTVSYVEIIDKLTQHPSKISHNCQRLLTAMAFFIGDGHARNMNFDTTPWCAQDVATVRSTIRDRLMEQLGTPVELWHAFCGFEDRTEATRAQFIESMCASIGIHVHDTVGEGSLSVCL